VTLAYGDNEMIVIFVQYASHFDGGLATASEDRNSRVNLLIGSLAIQSDCHLDFYWVLVHRLEEK
jgi:hypothetical protein